MLVSILCQRLMLVSANFMLIIKLLFCLFKIVYTMFENSNTFMILVQ